MSSASEESIAYSVISPHRPIHTNENGLFYYLKDRFECGELTSEQLRFAFRHAECREIGLRQVLHFHFEPQAIDFPIFSDCTLIDYHLSVDLRLTKEQSSVHYFDPSHASLRYLHKKTGVRIVVHVYYNHMGNPTSHAIHVRYIDSEGNELADKVLSEIQKDSIMLQTNQSKELLQQLLREKSHKQKLNLLEIETLASELGQAYEMNAPNIEALLRALIRKIQKKVQYNGVIDPQLALYEQQLSNCEQMKTSSQRIPVDHAPVDDRIESGIIATSSSQMKPKKLSAQQAIISIVDDLVAQDVIEDLDDMTVMAWVIRHSQTLKKIDTLCLILRFETKDAGIDLFIQNQWQRLPMQGSLSAYYRRHVLHGHTEMVRHLTPLMEETIELMTIYETLLDCIEQNAEPELLVPRIETADALYDLSYVYHKVLIAKQYQLKPNRVTQSDGRPEQDVLLGVLIRLFYDNNLGAFAMYLRQGLDLNGVQLVMTEVPHTILGGIIFSYFSHPNPEPYLDLILSSDTRISSPHVENANLAGYHVMGEKIHYHKQRGIFYYKRAGVRKEIPLMDLSNKAMTPMRSAIKNLLNQVRFDQEGIKFDYSKSPDLILALAKGMSPETLIQETMALLENNQFMTIYSNSRRPAVSVEVSSDFEIATLTQSTTDAVGESSDKGLSISFSLVPQIEQNIIASTLRATAQNLLKASLRVFQSSSITEQEDIIRNFYTLACIAAKNGQMGCFLYATRANIFCGLSMLSPTLQVHEVVLKTALFYGFSFAIKDKRLSGAMCKIAQDYFLNLSVAEQNAIRASNSKLIARITGGLPLTMFGNEARSQSSCSAAVSSPSKTPH